MQISRPTLLELPEIRVGSSVNNIGGDLYTVKHVVVHEHYNPLNTNNDISLITLNDHIEFKEGVQPIPLTEDSWDRHITEEAVVSGYGRTKVIIILIFSIHCRIHLELLFYFF